MYMYSIVCMYVHMYMCVCCLQYSSATQSWLEDAAIRLLCVFALDRFADFVSDQVKHTFIVYMYMYSLVDHMHSATCALYVLCAF